MESRDYLTYKTFYSEEEAVILKEFLSDRGIECAVEKSRPLIDRAYVGEGPVEFFLRMKSEDFSKANSVIGDYIERNISQIDTDYYLNDYTDAELKEILLKPDEWSDQDFFIARKILADRGQVFSDSDLNAMKWERYKELGQTESLSSTTIVFGYIVAILFSIIGAIWGAVLYQHKKTLPDGTRVYHYDQNARSHGFSMMIIGIPIFILGMLRIFFIRP